jgi:hypothetical protein
LKTFSGTIHKRKRRKDLIVQLYTDTRVKVSPSLKRSVWGWDLRVIFNQQGVCTVQCTKGFSTKFGIHGMYRKPVSYRVHFEEVF